MFTDDLRNKYRRITVRNTIENGEDAENYVLIELQWYRNVMSEIKLGELGLRVSPEDLEPIIINSDERCEHKLVREVSNAICKFNVGQRYVFNSVFGAVVSGLSSETLYDYKGMN